MESLTEKNFEEILTAPKNALTKQYELLFKTEGIDLSFTDGALKEIARVAFISNEQFENIGARRLYTVLEKLLEDISFDAPDIKEKKIVIDKRYVKEKLINEIQEKDVSKYIL